MTGGPPLDPETPLDPFLRRWYDQLRMDHHAPSAPRSPLQSPRLKALLPLGLAAACLCALVVAEARRPRIAPELVDLADRLHVQWVGRPAPGFTLPLMGGGRLSEPDLTGQPVLIHFWASWCPTCLPELELFGELRKRYGPHELRIVHVSLDEEWEEARRALPAGFGMELALDRSGAVSRAFGTEKLPEAYLLDAHGQVLLRFVANQPWLDPQMLRLLDGIVR